MKLTILDQLGVVLAISIIIFSFAFSLWPDALNEPDAPPDLVEPLASSVAIEPEEPQEAEESESQYNPEIPLSEDLQETLFSTCEEFGVDLSLALGLIQKESGFDVSIVSPKGCYGLCQLNPRYFPSGLSPTENIRYGVEYLVFQLDRYGDVKAALEAYHAGHDTGKRDYANEVLRYAEEWRISLTAED